MKTSLPLRLGIVAAALLPALVVITLSFGGSDPSLISVAGTVTADGKPLSRGTILFASDSQDHPAADVGSIYNGDYAIVNSERLAPGTYTVQILGPEQVSVPVAGTGADDPRPRSPEWIPSRYNTSSVIRVEIGRGGSHRFSFDLKL